jgi:septal ring factor EnvC (AmiA/AmiB activator)
LFFSFFLSFFLFCFLIVGFFIYFSFEGRNFKEAKRIADEIKLAQQDKEQTAISIAETTKELEHCDEELKQKKEEEASLTSNLKEMQRVAGNHIALIVIICF